MIVKIFAVFDSKAAFFGRPFSEQMEASAIRGFRDAVNDGSNPANLWHNHPEDFSLFMIGEFDDSTGELIPCIPKSLITASAIVDVTKPGKYVGDLFNRNGEKDKEEIIQ